MVTSIFWIPLPLNVHSDKWIWTKSVTRELSVKSAYLIQEDRTFTQQQFDPLWNIILKCKGLERVKIFLWTVVHGAIMTNEVRWRRKITTNPCCCPCLTETESIIHALRDCLNACGVWDMIIEVPNQRLFTPLTGSFGFWITYEIIIEALRERFGD